MSKKVDRKPKKKWDKKSERILQGDIPDPYMGFRTEIENFNEINKLKDSLIPPHVRTYLDQVKEEQERMQELLNPMMQMAKEEQERIQELLKPMSGVASGFLPEISKGVVTGLSAKLSGISASILESPAVTSWSKINKELFVDFNKQMTSIGEISKSLLGKISLPAIEVNKLLSQQSQGISSELLNFTGSSFLTSEMLTLQDSYDNYILNLPLETTPEIPILTTKNLRKSYDVFDDNYDYQVDEDSQEEIIEGLSMIDPKFGRMYEGARKSKKGKLPDYQRHYSISIREMFRKVTYILAPEEKVKEMFKGDPDLLNKEGKVKNRKKYLYMFSKGDPDLVIYIEEKVKLLNKRMKTISKVSHEDPIGDGEFEAVASDIDDTLLFILEQLDHKKNN